ncbi:hypothetical protein VD0004_g6405 [Verticillium dahliae]|nr:hypothetical protein VD0004_g6405 [Verticillium dahliae]PNH71732.1 hypothetical protein VD0001_g5806 [Verticillium dahliae]
MPLIDAGARPEETVSLPSPMGAKPAAVVTPEPEEDPDAHRGHVRAAKEDCARHA